jgi:P4 family phage/plasmid primase-like protien
LAVLLHTAYKDRFVCTSIKNNIWYAFENHRWVETDTGSVLRLELSTSIATLFAKKMFTGMMQDGPDLDKEAQSAAAKRVSKISGIIVELKNHTKKRNIMKEAADLFFERNFVAKLDAQPFIIGCTNGVIDFASENGQLFRDGKADDYVSKSTRLEYRPLTEKDDEIVEEINAFFRQLFPIVELREYMFEFLASLLIGKNHNQTFNILTGVGRNGKSALVELIGHVMGEYKATVPVSLITQKRQGIGASSSEVAQLMGVRFAVMQEPSKGDRINEGILKELTGGDPLQARALFKDSVTFEVLFKLIMCANDLPEIKSNDEGTWRRIRVCPFVSLFCENPVLDDPDKPYQFLVNKNMNEQFVKWSPVLFSMLVEKARVTKGIVNDCPLVLSKSNEYRCEQDLFSEFIRTCIKADTGGQVENTVLMEAFVDWWKSNQSASSRQPSNKELTQYMTRRNIWVRVSPPGRPVAWKNISLVQPEP